MPPSDRTGGRRLRAAGRLRAKESEASDETSVKVKHWGAYGIEGTTSTHQFDIADQRTRNGQAFITVGAID